MVHRSLVTDSATAPPVTTWCPTARAASRAGPTEPGYAVGRCDEISPLALAVGVGEVGVPAAVVVGEGVVEDAGVDLQ